MADDEDFGLDDDLPDWAASDGHDVPPDDPEGEEGDDE
jgi:hypothetical protein